MSSRSCKELLLLLLQLPLLLAMSCCMLGGKWCVLGSDEEGNR